MIAHPIWKGQEQITAKFPLKDMRVIVNRLYWEEYENDRETHKLGSTLNETTSHARGEVDHIFCNIVRAVDWLRKVKGTDASIGL